MDLVGYLETLPREALSRLYSSPWTSQAVLRGLPPLAKLYTLRMMFLEVFSHTFCLTIFRTGGLRLSVVMIYPVEGLPGLGVLSAMKGSILMINDS